MMHGQKNIKLYVKSTNCTRYGLPSKDLSFSL